MEYYSRVSALQPRDECARAAMQVYFLALAASKDTREIDKHTIAKLGYPVDGNR